MFRRLIRHPRTQAWFAAFGAFYLRLIAWTTRWRVVGMENVDAALGANADVPEASRSAIIAFWHERLPLMPPAWRHALAAIPLLKQHPLHMLVSGHRDGRMMGAVGEKFGVAMVHASSTRGGAVGVLTLARLLEDGQLVAITPDGPRGPLRQAKLGVAQLAALSARPVVPVAAATSRSRRVGTWDRMHVPFPFARGVIVIGPPIQVGREAAEASLPAITAAMTDVAEAADAALRRGPG